MLLQLYSQLGRSTKVLGNIKIYIQLMMMMMMRCLSSLRFRAKPRHLSYIYIYIYIFFFDSRIIPHVQMMFLGISASNRLCTPFKAEEAQEAAGDEAGNKRLCSHKATENWQPPLSIYIYEGIFAGH